MASPHITAEELREILYYNKVGRFFIWKTAPGPRSRIKSGAPAGCVVKRGSDKQYVEIKIRGRKYYAHRLAWLHVTGNLPAEQIDHIDGNSTSNRFSNLRDVSAGWNQHNQRCGPQQSNPYPGAYRHGIGWSSQIKVGGKKTYLGWFKTPEAARDAYLYAKAKMHGGAIL